MTTVVRPGRRRFVRSARRLAVMGAAAACTVLLAQHTTTAAFTAQTSVTGNTATTATTFCATPSSGFAVPGEDSSTNGTAGSTTQTNANGNLSVGTSAAGDGYGCYIRFATLPTVPSGCTVTSATLTLYASTSQAATMQVYRANTTWSRATLNWSNQPAAAGSPVPVNVPGGAGPQVFPVTQHVRDLYGIANHGFLIRDAASLTSTRYQIYTSFENSPVGNRPKLEVTWG